jgi:large subunit ribosomal protein L10
LVLIAQEFIVVLNLEEKKSAVVDICKVLESATSVVVADYRGTTVSSLLSLRSKAAKSGIKIQVVRNNILKIAIKETEFECLNQVLSGPSMIVVSYDEPGVGAKLFKEFSSSEDNFNVKGFAYNAEFFNAESIDKLACLPNREEALTKIACVLQAPSTKFVTTLGSIPSKLVNVLLSVKDQKSA